MPFYDLYCPSCGKEHRLRASMADKTEKRIPCPECGSFALETVFKGTQTVIHKSPSVPECPNRHVCGAGCCHNKA